MILLRRLMVLAVFVYGVLLMSHRYTARRVEISRPAHVAAYLERFGPMAAEVGSQTGVPPAIILAVSALESAYGSSELARDGNNFFGIKARGPGEARHCLPTVEYVRRRPRRVRACFRAYPDPYDSFFDFASFLTSEPRYKDLFSHSTTDYWAWADGLQRSGYATDPHYAEKIIRVVEQYGFYLVD